MLSIDPAHPQGGGLYHQYHSVGETTSELYAIIMTACTRFIKYIGLTITALTGILICILHSAIVVYSKDGE